VNIGGCTIQFAKRTDTLEKSVKLRYALFVISAAQLAIGITLYFTLAYSDLAFQPIAVAVCLGLLGANGVVFYLLVRLSALQESSRRLSLLAAMNVQVNREILLNEDLQLIYSTILDYLFSIFDKATTGSVLILGDDGYLRFAASKGFTEDFVAKFKLRLEDSFLYQVTGGNIKHARLISREDFNDVETVLKPGTWKYQSVVSAPIFVGDRLFGLLNLDSDVARKYDIKDVDIVDRFGAQIEVVLLARQHYTANIKRYQLDALTGLLTRRYFEEIFQITLDRAVRHQETFVIAVFDVDGLKLVNDIHGHSSGDELLSSVAVALRACGRNSDFIGRMGGDEFIACYPFAEIVSIERNIEVVHNKLLAQPIRFQNGVEHPSAFSYGLARFPEDGVDLKTLSGAADKRMYAMKSLRKKRDSS
jgi:diguanylate cyclase (GGDEF)-like protein